MSETMGKKRKALTLREKKVLSKYAMGGCMATLFVTGYIRNRTSMRIHSLAAYALLGLSIYHVSLYPKKERS